MEFALDVEYVTVYFAIPTRYKGGSCSLFGLLR
jgi:hypothetical protein